MNNTTQHPEFERARQAIEVAVAAIEADGGDLRSFANAMIGQATALHCLTFGDEGPSGTAEVLYRLAEAYRRRVHEQVALATHGVYGRA